MTNDVTHDTEKDDLAEAWDTLLALTDQVFDRRGSVNVAIRRMTSLRPDRRPGLRADAGKAAADLCQTIKQTIAVGEEIARWLEAIDSDSALTPSPDVGRDH
jgi:hypothetical protein